MRMVSTLACLGCLIAAMFGCPPKEQAWEPPAKFPKNKAEKDYYRQLPPGALALRRIPPEMYPDFSRGFNGRDGLEQAIRHSIEYLKKPSSRKYYPYGDISHERALGSLHTFLMVLRQAQSPEQFDQLIRDRFEVYQSVGCDDQGTVLYTGYYCPIFEGRKQRDAVFRFPLYRSPPDLIRDQEGNTTGRRMADGRIVPYATRREIEEQRQLEGTEIAWLKSPFEAYVVSVQGSAKLKLADGSLWELGYAGNNGHEYKPIAAAMIADGVLKKADLSLQALIRYFEQHPQDVQKYCWQNPRYIFFKETAGGPYGSIGVPVTRLRSLATDKSIFPRACLAFIDTELPMPGPDGVAARPHAEFALDQDTGGAIRAAGRCDVYMGVGPDAEALAGRTYAEGDLYYIFVKTGGGTAAAR